MSRILFIYRYFIFLIKSQTRYTVHSEFVYDFINNVLRDKTKYKDYKLLWDNRNKLASSQDQIETVDFGSKSGRKSYKTIILPLNNIVKSRSHSKSRMELIYRIVKNQSPANVLEFGTCVGVSSFYIKKAYPESKFITMEGCASLAAKAQDNFSENGFSDVEIVVGNFDSILNDILKGFTTLDFIFFDGNHREIPTVSYFESCAELSNENSIFVFDDIHWSKGMENAWNKIKADKRVSVSIDLFWFGILFFRKGIEKQDFVLRY